MKLGCNTVLFGGFDVKTALECIKLCGYTAVEFSAIPGMAEHLKVDDEASVAIAREALSATGLQAVAIEAATDIFVEANRQRLGRVFQMAASLDIPVVTVGSGGKSGDEELTAAAIRHIAELANVAEASGVELALKVHVGASVYNVATALRLMSEVKSKALTLNYDATHLIREGEDAVGSFQSLRPYIGHIHIRDTYGTGPAISPPPLQTAGRGTVDLPGVVAQLCATGYNRAVDLEIIGAAQFPLQDVVAIAAESRGYFHRLFREHGVEI